jgi:uncharacterized protein (TIGR00661 family)
MKVLYGVCSWGLGHATRSLPILRKLIDEGNQVTIVATGSSLELLKMELGTRADYIDIPDYPLPYTEKSNVFLLKFAFFLPTMTKALIKEHKRIKKLLDKRRFDIIISDNRYGVFHKDVKSLLITHQLRVMAPRRIKAIENGFERFNAYIQRYFKYVMVPDYEDDGISGDLAHNLNIIKNARLVYFGILSDFKKLDVVQDVDFLFSISGPEPQRSVMENLILENINDIRGKIIVSLGRKTNDDVDKMRSTLNENIQLFDFLPRKERELIMNRSKFIVSRSGYSTLMDIYTLRKKAMFIPTPQQTEQEYLARHHEGRGNFYYIDQDKLNLQEDLEKAKSYKGPDKDCDIEKTTERFLEVVYG